MKISKEKIEKAAPTIILIVGVVLLLCGYDNPDQTRGVAGAILIGNWLISRSIGRR